MRRKTDDETDLSTDSEGMEAMFQIRAIELKIEQDENTDLWRIYGHALSLCYQ